MVGIAAMQLSLVAAPLIGKKAKLSAVMSPMPNENEFYARVKRFENRRVGDLLTGCLNKMLALCLIKRAGLGPEETVKNVSPQKLRRLRSLLRSWELPVLGTGGYPDAQVMLGGADTKDFEAETLESRRVKGLYAVGEMLSVAGPCGGYNLEWAWASGLLAGRKAAESL